MVINILSFWIGKLPFPVLENYEATGNQIAVPVTRMRR